MRMRVRSLASLSGLKDPEFPRAAGCRHSSDPVLLWMWHLFHPLVWELPHATGAALKKKKKKKKVLVEDQYNSNFLIYQKYQF